MRRTAVVQQEPRWGRFLSVAAGGTLLALVLVILMVLAVTIAFDLLVPDRVEP